MSDFHFSQHPIDQDPTDLPEFFIGTHKDTPPTRRQLLLHPDVVVTYDIQVTDDSRFPLHPIAGKSPEDDDRSLHSGERFTIKETLALRDGTILLRSTES